MLELLLRSGVTTVAEAAFQDHVWRPRLKPLTNLARIRVVHCAVAADVTFARALRRGRDDPLRRARRPGAGRGGGARSAHRAFRRASLDVPWLEVGTTGGYRPSFGRILSFAGGKKPVGGEEPGTPDRG